MDTPTHSEDTISELVPIYSPRWGYPDHYSVNMTRSRLTITLNTKTAEWVLTPEGNAIWSGHRVGITNPVLQIMSDDAIYAPAGLPEALERLLCQWGQGVADRASVTTALKDLLSWVDHTARGKPASDFWRQYF